MAESVRLVAAGRELTFDAGRALTIGRASSSDVRLSNPYVSGSHGRLVPGPEGWTYLDVGSKNGTYRLGERVQRVMLVGPTTLLLGAPGCGVELHIDPHERSTIFVSYRRGDSAGHAGRLRDRLAERFGESRVFRDIDSLRMGEDFVDGITRTLSDCRVIIVVIGLGWLEATNHRGVRRLDDPEDYVRVEIVTALTKSPPATVIPLLVQGARMPRTDELPVDLQPLTRRGALLAPDEHWESATDRLLGTIERVLKPSSMGSVSLPDTTSAAPSDAASEG